MPTTTTAAQQPIAKPTLDFARKIIDAFYQMEGNICGGSLHIVTDDGNVETHHVEFCLNYARERGDQDGIFLAQLLLQFTQAERETLMGCSSLLDDDEPQNAVQAAAGGLTQTAIEH